jgi:hypothetical protein
VQGADAHGSQRLSDVVGWSRVYAEDASESSSLGFRIAPSSPVGLPQRTRQRARVLGQRWGTGTTRKTTQGGVKREDTVPALKADRALDKFKLIHLLVSSHHPLSDANAAQRGYRADETGAGLATEARQHWKRCESASG